MFALKAPQVTPIILTASWLFGRWPVGANRSRGPAFLFSLFYFIFRLYLPVFPNE